MIPILQLKPKQSTVWQGNGVQQLFKARSQILHAQIDSKTKVSFHLLSRAPAFRLLFTASRAPRLFTREPVTALKPRDFKSANLENENWSCVRPKGPLYNPAHAGADRRAVRTYPSTRHPHGGG